MEITVRNDSAVMSDSDVELLGVKLLKDESGCQICTNFKLTAALHLSTTPPSNNALNASVMTLASLTVMCKFS